MYRDCFPFYAKSCDESERVFSYFRKVSWIFGVFYYHIFCRKFKTKKELKKAKKNKKKLG
jgi:hypothetical protein